MPPGGGRPCITKTPMAIIANYPGPGRAVWTPPAERGIPRAGPPPRGPRLPRGPASSSAAGEDAEIYLEHARRARRPLRASHVPEASAAGAPPLPRGNFQGGFLRNREP